MSGRFRIKTWEAACIAASGLVTLGVVTMAVYDNFGAAARSAVWTEKIATAFEDPACADFVQLPLTALPTTADMVGHRCFDVLAMRQIFSSGGAPEEISAARIRALQDRNPIKATEIGRDVAVVGGPLLAGLYGFGLASEFIARRVRIVGAPVQGLVDLLSAGRGRRVATFALCVALFLALVPLLVCALVVVLRLASA